MYTYRHIMKFNICMNYRTFFAMVDRQLFSVGWGLFLVYLASKLSFNFLGMTFITKQKF